MRTAACLADAGSQNGTWRNGERCERARLEDGDVIQIGSTQLVFREGSEAESTFDGGPPDGLADARRRRSTDPGEALPPGRDAHPRDEHRPRGRTASSSS